MKSVTLLDVNVLVALVDADHVHHELAHDWFADRGSQSWATCPVTENGFVRVLTNPAYQGGELRPDASRPGHGLALKRPDVDRFAVA